jgi:hypothetical protein
VSIVIGLVLGLLGVTGSAEQPPRDSNPCVTDSEKKPRLLPVDEAPSNPEFLAYRTRLRAAVDRRDVDAVVQAMNPDIKLDFGGSFGVAMFRQLVAEQPDTWEDMRWVLAHGGLFMEEDLFSAPYVFKGFPDEYDSFECAAITGSNVRLRTAPRLDAPIAATMSYSIVRMLDIDAGNGQWPRVRLPNGREGHVAKVYVRMPIETRAVFNRIDGRWQMTAFLAGD